MNNKSSQTTRNRRQTKKALVLGTGRRRRTPLIVAAVVFTLGAAALGLSLRPWGHGTPPTASSPAAAAETERISHAAADFADGRARHFQYADAVSGLTINYFVLKSSDGVIRAAFDACDVCWPEGKGYVQEGDNMVCRNCGRRFASVKINEVKGGCNPAPLARIVEGGRVIIRVDDLRAGRAYFDFSGKA